MSGIFLTYPVHYEENHKGIIKKIRGQINAFKINLIQVEEVQLASSKLEISAEVLKKIQWLPYINVWPRWTYSREYAKADFIYMRRPSAMSGSMRYFLKRIKKENPNIKVILEIPTYPYDEEYIGIKKLLLLKDKYNRTKLAGLIDRFAIVGCNELIPSLWNIPVIQFDNGVEINTITMKHRIPHKSIRIICVAMFAPRHGYERLIDGLHQYHKMNGKLDFELHFVGSGSEITKYKKLVSKYLMNSKVYFHGSLFGNDLDNMYASCDIAAGPFGLYKVGIQSASALKISESLARGLPVIVGSEIRELKNGKFPYYLEFPNDSTPVDFNLIENFWLSISNNKDTNIKIRDFATKHFDLSNTMRPIFNYIKGNDE